MTPGRQRATGFTLIETLVAMAIAAILSSVAYPSYQGQVQKARRADAIVAMTQVQLAQERWRANHSRYAGLVELALGSTSPSGHYHLTIDSADRSRYEVRATAAGLQSADTACAHLRMSIEGGNTRYASGPDASAANDAAQNRRCWSL